LPNLEWTTSDSAVPCAPPGHRPDGLADARDEWSDAMIAIRIEFPDARIIVPATYAGDGHVQRAMKAGDRAYLLKSLFG
jgi:hypothetical protein